MNREEFLKQFGHFVEAPNGIELLKQLIYRLASAGRLFDNGEAVTYSLGEVAEFVMGQAPPGSACNKDGNGTIFVKTGEFGALYPDVREWTTKPLKLAKKGDVLICVVGATIGKLNLAIDCAIGRSVAAIRPSSVLDVDYLYTSLMPFVMRLRAQSRGSAQGTITKAELASIKIRLPNISRQRETVRKVKEAMALCDRLEAERNAREETHQRLIRAVHHPLTEAPDATATQTAWRRIRDNFAAVYSTYEGVQNLRQSIYVLAIEGKLVPQDPNEEPASAFLKRLKGAEAQLKRNARWQAAVDESASSELPNGWAQVVFGELGTIKGGGTPSKQNPNYWVGDIPWVTPKDMKVDVIRDSIDHISESAISNSAVKLIRRNSLLMVVRGMILAHSFPVAVAAVEVTINQDMKALEALDDSIVPFLHVLLKGKKDRVLNAVERSSHGTCRLDSNSLFGMTIALPPLAEQSRIVEKVGELMDLCDHLEASIRAKSNTAALYAEAVVQQIAAA